MDATLQKLIYIIALFLFTFPGLISMHVYRLMVPAKSIDWKDSTSEGLFYSAIIFFIFLPIFLISYRFIYPKYPFGCIFAIFWVVLAASICLPWIWYELLTSKMFTQKLQLPFPTAWDYFFNKRLPVFMLIHLKNGKNVGGYFGVDSYATSFPQEGELYLQAVYEIRPNGEFIQPIDSTRGLLIKKEEYSYIEIFDVPNT